MAGIAFDWNMVAGQAISTILGTGESTLSNDTFSWVSVAFVVGDSAVVLTVNVDTDEVEVAHQPAPSGPDWSPATSLAEFTGRRLGWAWQTTNTQGYLDGFMMAFCGEPGEVIDPRILFVGVASTLHRYDIVAR